jgi:hypothetical protein
MRDARRRPYVDRVKPGNEAGGAPERGAGIGATWSRAGEARSRCPPLWVRPLSRPWRVVRRPMRVTGGHIPRGAPVPPLDAPRLRDATGHRGQIPEGRLTTVEQGPQFIGDATRVRRKGSPPTIACEVRSPEKHRGPSSALRRSSSAPRRAPVFGDATAEARDGHADSSRRAWPAAGSHLRPRAQALLRPPRAVLAAT